MFQAFGSILSLITLIASCYTKPTPEDESKNEKYRNYVVSTPAVAGSSDSSKKPAASTAPSGTPSPSEDPPVNNQPSWIVNGSNKCVQVPHCNISTCYADKNECEKHIDAGGIPGCFGVAGAEVSKSWLESATCGGGHQANDTDRLLEAACTGTVGKFRIGCDNGYYCCITCPTGTAFTCRQVTMGANMPVVPTVCGCAPACSPENPFLIASAISNVPGYGSFSCHATLPP